MGKKTSIRKHYQNNPVPPGQATAVQFQSDESMPSPGGAFGLDKLMCSIRRRIAPPSFGSDEEKTRQASMLNLALINILILIPVLIIGNLIGGKTPMPVIVMNALVFAFCLVLYRWMHMGRIRLASTALIAMGIFAITVSIASLGTVRAPSTTMYVLMILTAGLLFDINGIILITALCSVLVAGLIIAGNMGILPSPDYSVTITQWIAFTAIFGWTGSLTYSALLSVHQALAHARKEIAERRLAEDELAKHRDQLEEVIRRRTAELEEKNCRLQEEISERKKIEEDLMKSKEKYRSIFENSILGLYQSLPSGRYLSVNPAFAKLFGYSSPEEMLQSVNDIGHQLYANPADRERAIKLVTEQGFLEGFELEVKRRDGTKLWVSMNTLIAESEDKVHFDGTVEDITERKKAEAALKAERDRAERYLNIAEVILVVLDTQARITLLNRKGYQVLGYAEGELTGKRWIETCLHQKDHERVYEVNRKIVAGEIEAFEYYESYIITKDGRERFIAWHTTILRDDDGNITGTLSSGEDITDKKMAQEALLDSKNFLDKIINSISDPIFVTDKEHRFILANDADCALIGRPREEVIGRTARDFFSEEQASVFLQSDEKVLLTGEENISEEIVTDWKGVTRTVIAKKTLYLDQKGDRNIVGIVRDITDRKQAEDNLKASLMEKEILLKEVHHRVKNNLQIVSSLLSIQANNIQDEGARDAISECRNRVKSIALIHEKLYRSENLAKVDFAGYISGLTKSLFSSFGVDRRRIRLQMDLGPVFLSIDKAIPCGLIVNELVSNCLKHAFPGDGPGTVQVQLKSPDEDRVLLIISDDGTGLPDGIQPQKTKTLGLRLVNDLVRQIKGDLQMDSSCGTEFEISFPAV